MRKTRIRSAAVSQEFQAAPWLEGRSSKARVADEGAAVGADEPSRIGSGPRAEADSGLGSATAKVTS